MKLGMFDLTLRARSLILAGAASVAGLVFPFRPARI
jgi:hypothetical protein